MFVRKIFQQLCRSSLFSELFSPTITYSKTTLKNGEEVEVLKLSKLFSGNFSFWSTNPKKLKCEETECLKDIEMFSNKKHKINGILFFSRFIQIEHTLNKNTWENIGTYVCITRQVHYYVIEREWVWSNLKRTKALTK